MYHGARIAAVVPAYKEEKMIATVISTMPDFVDFIVIVDDCSPDQTSAVVNLIADDRVTLIRHEVNQGVGGAIVTGHKAAMELGADVNVIMAGDAQMDPNHLPALLDKVTRDGYGSPRPIDSSPPSRLTVCPSTVYSEILCFRS